jgi:hypothetical protein
MNETVLTAREDREKRGQCSSAGGVTKHQYETLAGGDGNNPGERGTCQTSPGKERTARGVLNVL